LINRWANRIKIKPKGSRLLLRTLILVLKEKRNNLKSKIPGILRDWQIFPE